jgi:hypothetical protein
MAVVPAEERSAAGGFTGVARTGGRGHQSTPSGISICATFLDQRSVVHRGELANRLRPASLPFVAKTASPDARQS